MIFKSPSDVIAPTFVKIDNIPFKPIQKMIAVAECNSNLVMAHGDHVLEFGSINGDVINRSIQRNVQDQCRVIGETLYQLLKHFLEITV